VHHMAHMHRAIALLRKTTRQAIVRRPPNGRALPANNIMVGDPFNSLRKSHNFQH
jgi:type II secretory pathway component PulJ